MRDADLQPQHIAQLLFECSDVGIARKIGATMIETWLALAATRIGLGIARELFGIAH